MTTEKIITARFHSRCRDCGKDIAVGAKVRWSRGSKAAHEVCPPPVPSFFASYRWHGTPERETSKSAGQCYRCDKEIPAGEEHVSCSVRRKGRSSDDYLEYHVACWEAATRPSEAAASSTPTAPAAPAASAPETAAPAPRRIQRGQWCRKCGGPASDGSGLCGEC